MAEKKTVEVIVGKKTEGKPDPAKGGKDSAAPPEQEVGGRRHGEYVFAHGAAPSVSSTRARDGTEYGPAEIAAVPTWHSFSLYLPNQNADSGNQDVPASRRGFENEQEDPFY